MKNDKIREKTELQKARGSFLSKLTHLSLVSLLSILAVKSPARIKEAVFLWILAILSTLVIGHMVTEAIDVYKGNKYNYSYEAE